MDLANIIGADIGITCSSTNSVITGSISGTTLTVTELNFGFLAVGETLSGTGVADDTVISGYLSGAGGLGTYTVSIAQIVLSTVMQVSGNADIAVVQDPVEGQQRVLRRLLTNPGNYYWQPAYGAGLAAFIGQPVITGSISGTIKSQMKMEQSVIQSPPPAVSVTSQQNGVVLASIQYIDAQSQLTSSLTIPLTQITAGDV